MAMFHPPRPVHGEIKAAGTAHLSTPTPSRCRGSCSLDSVCGRDEEVDVRSARSVPNHYVLNSEERRQRSLCECSHDRLTAAAV